MALVLGDRRSAHFRGAALCVGFGGLCSTRNSRTISPMAADFEQACQGVPGLAEVHRLITTRELQQARDALSQLPESPGREVANLRLELEIGDDPPERVMQRLVQLMRKHPQAPGARELYTRCSDEAYGARSSSPSHSHPYLPRVVVGPPKDKD